MCTFLPGRKKKKEGRNKEREWPFFSVTIVNSLKYQPILTLPSDMGPDICICENSPFNSLPANALNRIHKYDSYNEADSGMPEKVLLVKKNI